MVRRELAAIPVSRLRETTGGRLRIGPLEQYGVTTVADVHGVSPSSLQQVPGVGPTTAAQLVAAARQVAEAVRDGLRIRVDLDPADAASTALISALHQLRELDAVGRRAEEPAARLADAVDDVLPTAALGAAGCVASSPDAGGWWRSQPVLVPDA
jgi:transposase